jgi:hypothetical protein
VCSILEIEGREYHYSQVRIGRQYDPSEVIALRNLNDWKLIGNVIQLDRFVALEELNLSGNLIRDFRNMGLENLPNLKVKNSQTFQNLSSSQNKRILCRIR